MEEEVKKIKSIRCGDCKSTFGYYLITRKAWQCRKCGKVTGLEENKQ